MKIVNKIIKIIGQQVDRLEEKSKKSNLDQEEIDQLKTMAETVIALSVKMKATKKRTYKSGQYLSDADLMEYASGKTKG